MRSGAVLPSSDRLRGAACGVGIAKRLVRSPPANPEISDRHAHKADRRLAQWELPRARMRRVDHNESDRRRQRSQKQDPTLLGWWWFAALEFLSFEACLDGHRHHENCRDDERTECQENGEVEVMHVRPVAAEGPLKQLTDRKRPRL